MVLLWPAKPTLSAPGPSTREELVVCFCRVEVLELFLLPVTLCEFVVARFAANFVVVDEPLSAAWAALHVLFSERKGERVKWRSEADTPPSRT